MVWPFKSNLFLALLGIKEETYFCALIQHRIIARYVHSAHGLRIEKICSESSEVTNFCFPLFMFTATWASWKPRSSFELSQKQNEATTTFLTSAEDKNSWWPA